ncbi:alpha/beta hydrolase [Streptomyces sp. KN37]|uniref:alpha/beta hydrolase n=1 Tax=Streptomyces sp. KN37 TaxID=3090667 RepID=UPI002A74EA77|nr:alpha/beta hydrolase [Streptomyces sp. KN37]WPO76097.1 alpha/beta hydrolase [Streptomyces sp. KN37]
MRVASTITAGLGPAGLLAGGVAAAAPPPKSTPRPLSWGACSAAQKELIAAGAQCAKVTVPLDYADPEGRTIRLAISRIKAKSPARRGILLSNPGGPGGTGLANTLALRPALKDVADRYDLIGFDPRFLGESTPLTCGPAPRPAPPAPTTTPREDFEASVRAARDTARRCQEHGDNATLLPHASTRNVARDMDAIRAALGESKLSYYGVSYGADLGAVYTQLFPRRADRVVLDSSTDPAATQYELFQRSGAPAEAALAPRVRADVQELLARAERLESSVVGGAIFMCGDGGWPAGGWPRNPATYWKNMQRSRATQPVFGPYVNGMIAPCAFWGSEPREPGTTIGKDVPILLLQARHDNNVPYEGALALHRRLTGSRLLTADIRAHGVYGRGNDGLTPVPCADRAVNTYLRDGELPAADLTCPKPEARS